MAVVFEKPKSLTDATFHYCPGCPHGIIHRLVAEVLDELGIEGKAIGVAPVGCAVMAYDYFACDMIEAAHGRAPAVATGIKRCRPENVVFTYNTTYALNIAIKAFVKEKSHILISDMEHNSVLRPVNALCRDKECTFSTFSSSGSDEEILDSIERNIKPYTSLLVCAHVSNVGCRRLPIDKIGALCRNRGIKFIVDGAQSAGIHPIDVNNMFIHTR